MIAAGESKGEEATEGKPGKKSPPWLWPLIVVGDIIALAAVAYFIANKPVLKLNSLVRFIETHFSWIVAGGVAFFVLALILALRKSREPPAELIQLAEEMGWGLKRSWGLPGGFGAVSLFGYGSYFQVSHRGLPLVFSPIIDEDGRKCGLRGSITLPRPLCLGLMVRTGIQYFFEGRMPDEWKGIFSEKVPLSLDGFEPWAGDREKAQLLLASAPVVTSLKALKRELDVMHQESGPSGVVLSDKTISLLLSEEHSLTGQIIERLCDVSHALNGSEVIPATPVSRTGERVYRAVLITLIVLTAAAMFWVIADKVMDFITK